jgi:hypothetical protein
MITNCNYMPFIYNFLTPIGLYAKIYLINTHLSMNTV